MSSEVGKFKNTFDPETVSVINRAYEAALAALGGPDGHSDQRAALAKHLMDLAMDGETDEVRLRDGALAKLSLNGEKPTYTGL